MKVQVYEGGLKMVEKSGIGMAVQHQKQAILRAGMEYTAKAETDCDVVQFNTIFPDSYIMSKIAKRQGKKVVYYGHSTMEDFQNSFIGSNLLAPLFKKWITKCYENGDVIITPTEYSKKILESYGIKKTIVNLTNGIDIQNYKKSKMGSARFREKYNLSDDEKVIISVGHFIERKGILDFIELAKRFPEYTFIWFGYTNPNLIPKNIQTAIKTKLPNLIFAGYVDKNELKDAYSGSDLFLFLTQEETEGIVVLEAMAMELPLLIRDIPIYEKWLPDKEAAYKGKCLEEFEDLLPKMLEGRNQNLTEKALQIVQKNDIVEVGRKLHNIYDRLLVGEGNKNESFNYNGLVQTCN